MSNGEKREADRPIPSVIRRSIIACLYIILFAVCLYIPPYIVDELCGAEKVLNVCAFTETFAPEAIERFEKKMGVTVNMTYVELDEQIYAKFKVDDGAGYDVINVSDFMAQILASQGLLSPLDHAKIKHKAGLNPLLLNLEFDCNNTFSLPHKWFLYGVVYDKKFFNLLPDQMNLNFVFKDPEELCAQSQVPNPYKVCMIDSPLDAYFLASLFKKNGADITNPEGLSPSLIAQKKWVECYTLYSIEYFLFKDIVPIALTSSNFMRKIWDEDKRFDFAIPQEGGILVVENLVIPQKSKRMNLAHAFIDFMLSDEIAELNGSTYKWSSANRKANQELDKEYPMLSHLYLTDTLMQRLHIPLLDVQRRREIYDSWLQVGFA